MTLLAFACLFPPFVMKAQFARPSFDHGIRGGGGESTSSRLPDTVRVLAVMTEFQTDQETRTSGTGKFGTVYGYDYGAEILDPYPHDRAYFRDHLRFLENYVRKASNGQTVLVADLLDPVVTVPKQIKDYTFKKGDTETATARLAVDAWTAADQLAPNTPFSRYHMFIVFHAGRGRDVDMVSLQGSDPTPLDIPSLSFTPSGFRRLLGSDFAGIPVNGGSFAITNTAIIPTTDNREVSMADGRTALLELSINGLLAAGFGTWAGLPDLFDTKTGRTGIGRFGLMDAEAIFAYGGACPPAPNAWEKIALGWTVPRDAAPGTQSYLITASRTDEISTTDILRIPILPREYWLVENRQRDPGGNGQRVTMKTNGQETELRFPKDTTGFTNGDVSALKGVVTDVEDLDWALPGGRVQGVDRQITVTGGLLLWHVDETIVDANRDLNTVNAQPLKRGVDLEQAAGPQDIGEFVSNGFGTELATGSPLDYWFQGNISPLYKNRFDAGTWPDTRSNSGAQSHVAITDIGAPGPVMSLTISRGDGLVNPAPGYPVDLRVAASLQEPRALLQAADLDRDGNAELLAAVWPGVPTNLGASALVVTTLDGLPYRSTYLTALLQGITRWTTPPTVGDVTGDGIPEIALQGLADSGEQLVVILSAMDSDGDGYFDEKHRISRVVSDVPVITGGRIVVARRLSPSQQVLETWNGSSGSFPMPLGPASIAASPVSHQILVAQASGSVLIDLNDGAMTNVRGFSAPSASPATAGVLAAMTANMDGYGAAENIVFADNHVTISGLRDAQNTDYSLRSLPLRNSQPMFAIADVDGNQRYDLCIADSSQILALNFSSAQVDSWPTQREVNGLVVARFAGEKADAVFAIGNSQLTQLDARARPAAGFPLALPSSASVCLLSMTMGSERHLGIAFSGNDGQLSLMRIQQALDSNGVVWSGTYGDSMNRRLVPDRGQGGSTTSTFFPPERCYNWPNPAYDGITKIRLFVTQQARVTVKIHDLAGARVTELTSTAIAGIDNEIDWNLDGIESGVYIATVEAVADGQSATKVLKIAVVR